MLEATTPITLVSQNLAREVTSLPGPISSPLRPSTWKNLDPGDGATKFNALADRIVNSLRAPDILALEEIQDNNGPTGQRHCGRQRHPEHSDQRHCGGRRADLPVSPDQPGERSGRRRAGRQHSGGLSVSARTGGCSSLTVPAGPRRRRSAWWTARMGRSSRSAPDALIPPTAPSATAANRWRASSSTTDSICLSSANHFNSKAGRSAVRADSAPCQLLGSAAASAGHHCSQLVQSLLSKDAQAKVVVLGDLNDFEFSDTLSILKGGALTDLIETLPENERYTYVFEGNSQAWIIFW